MSTRRPAEWGSRILSSTLRRAWLLVNITVTVALLPALFPDGDRSPGAASAAAAGAVAARPATVVVPTDPTTTTTSAPPTTVVVEVEPATTTTTSRPRPTTTTTTPTTTTTTTSTTAPPPAEPAPSGSESGWATWYDYKPGICAHKTLPFGTVVTVHAVNGKRVHCTVGDRGPYVDGYVIDLHHREFEQLAPRSTGRIDVTITW